jgi:hypothetical protein
MNKMKRMKNFSMLITVFPVIMLSFSSCKKEEGPQMSYITFEEMDLGEDGIWNGSGGEGGFTSGNGYFRNSYGIDEVTQFEYWSGFSVSDQTDKTTPGIANQYSSVTGGGHQSDQYAVLYSYAEDTIEFLTPQKIQHMAVSNSTYAYLSMKNGDLFAKKFGGETGSDPDYFCVIFKAVGHDGTVYTFSDSLFLADFRSPDPLLDYVYDGWVSIDLSVVGYLKYLIIKMDSSDKTGGYINTPTYICIDDIEGEFME